MLPLTDPAAPLATPRDRHLFAPGRKRILSLDGGGIRGAVTLAFVERLEAEIDALEGRATRLCDWFDLIGGTSTGAIIATALALGYRAAQVRDFYFALGPSIFKPRWWRLFGWNAKFDARVLAGELDRIIGARTMDSPDLLTGLSIIMKRLDTGSAWAVMNNPRSAFWNDPPGGSFRGNRHLPVANLVRASTAAPSFFDPEPISVLAGQPPGVFIDGGLTPHNNPSLMLLMSVLIPAFGLSWRPGAKDLLVVSVGTGSFRPVLSLAQARASSSFGLALRSLSAVIAENQQLVLTLMSYFGETVRPWQINSEVGDLGGVTPPGGDMFRFARYDLRLETEWLARELGDVLPPDTVLRLQRMDDAANLHPLYELGRKAAALQVHRTHLETFRRDELSA